MPPAPIPQNEASRLATLRRYSILDSLSEPEFDDASALAASICGTPVSLVSLIDRDRQWFKAAHGTNLTETPRTQSFCAYTLLEPKTLIVRDAQTDPRFSDNPLVTGNPRIRFYAGSPIVAPNGQVLGTLCVIDTHPRDLTPTQISALEALSRQVMALIESRANLIENKRAIAALIQSEKLAAVGRLASSMAHEINNPLEAITNLLYLCRGHAISPDVQQWLDEAELELRRISLLANQTLRFHRQSTRPHEISCLNLFAPTLDLYEARLRNAGITVEKRKRAHQLVECYEGDIRQVLSNLITNAIDAMPTGGRLLVRSREGTDWCSGRKGIFLTVADTGIGIDPKIQEQIFDAFFTTKGINGAGLGLWMSSEIMRRHNGYITIRSSQAPGRSGTVAVLFLPIDAAKEMHALEPSSSESAA
ncbi:MAG: GAF domain-containing sensor histidine kinase [Acidobacteriaceae bacterium]